MSEESIPAPASTDDLTSLLQHWGSSDPAAATLLMDAIYEELRKRARFILRRERPGHTLQATALVHEVYLRLLRQSRTQWQNRNHFFGIATQMMRRIMLDYARRNLADKRGGQELRITFHEVLKIPGTKDLSIFEVDELLSRLAALDSRQAQIVEMRVFGGLTVEEIAEAIEVSIATVNREWRTARLWLSRELSQKSG